MVTRIGERFEQMTSPTRILVASLAVGAGIKAGESVQTLDIVQIVVACIVGVSVLWIAGLARNAIHSMMNPRYD
jgi:hypothetical protein